MVLLPPPDNSFFNCDDFFEVSCLLWNFQQPKASYMDWLLLSISFCYI